MSSVATSTEKSEIRELMSKSVDELTKIYADKSVELDVCREILDFTVEKLEKRKEDLAEERKKLDGLHQRVWSSIDEFCDNVRRLSVDCDVGELANRHLEGPPSSSSEGAEEDQRRIRFLEYQVKLLSDEIKNLQENLETVDLEEKTGNLEVQEDEKSWKNEEDLPLQENKRTKRPKSPVYPPKLRKPPKSSKKLEKSDITAEKCEEKFLKVSKTPKNHTNLTQNLKFAPCGAENDVKVPKIGPKISIENLKTPENQKIKVDPKISTFSLKKKSKICEKFEKQRKK